jgi:hypothetical protein
MVTRSMTGYSTVDESDVGSAHAVGDSRSLVPDPGRDAERAGPGTDDPGPRPGARVGGWLGSGDPPQVTDDRDRAWTVAELDSPLGVDDVYLPGGGLDGGGSLLPIQWARWSCQAAV